MKRTLAILLLIPTLVFAVPNPAVESALSKAAGELSAAQGEREALKLAVSGAGEVSKAKDQVIAVKDAEIARVAAERDAARGWGTKIKVIVLIGLASALTVFATVAFLAHQYREAGVCAFGAGSLFTASSVVAYKDDLIATYGLIGGSVLAVLIVVYLIFKIWHNRNASEEFATVPELLKTNPAFTAEQRKIIDKTSFQETGKLGDRIRSYITGKPEKELARAGDIEVAPAATVVMSVPQSVAVTSGVVTPVGA